MIYSLPIWQELENVKRNVRIFLFGTILWALFYCLVYYYRTEYRFMEPFYYSLIVIYLADAFTMAYLYKYKYGRVITAEIGDSNDDKWVYDEGRYRRKDIVDRVKENIKKEERLKEVLNEVEEMTSNYTNPNEDIGTIINGKDYQEITLNEKVIEKSPIINSLKKLEATI
jgi:hypothetical protein